MGPFDRFNDRAKRVLALAQDEAIRFHHDHIGPEHLLLGLMREGQGVAARTLESLGAELSKARVGVEHISGRGESSTAPNEIYLHPRTKRIIERAIEESRKLGHSHVGTEHLLLGMVHEGGGVAAGVLEALGISLERVRQQVIATLGQAASATDETAARGAPPGFFQDAEGRKRDWYCEDVLAKKLAVKVLYEDERVLGFEHPYPWYRIHGVVIPKAHVSGVLAPEALDPDLLLSLLRGVQAVAKALGLEGTGFRVEANAAAPGVTPHMHWHVAGPGLPPPTR